MNTICNQARKIITQSIPLTQNKTYKTSKVTFGGFRGVLVWLIWLLLRCVGALWWFVKRDLVERSMIHECSNHVHRGKTHRET